MQYPLKIHSLSIGTEQKAVNAKELHTALGSNTKYADWITRRIKKYGFEENRDYIVVTEHTQGRPLKEYYITLDMAKELAMVENNEQGRKIRRYFIEVEKEFHNPSRGKASGKSIDHVIRGYKGKIAAMQKTIEELRASQEVVIAFDMLPEEIDRRIQSLEKELQAYRSGEILLGNAWLHDSFLEFMFQAHLVKDETYRLSQDPKCGQKFKNAHASMSNFLRFMGNRFNRIRGIQTYIPSQHPMSKKETP